MRQVDIDELCNYAEDSLLNGESLTIVQNGEPIGLLEPTEERRRAGLKKALDDLGETVQRILDDTGMTEDELVRLFDLNQPLPEEPFPTRHLAATSATSGH